MCNYIFLINHYTSVLLSMLTSVAFPIGRVTRRPGFGCFFLVSRKTFLGRKNVPVFKNLSIAHDKSSIIGLICSKIIHAYETFSEKSMTSWLLRTKWSQNVHTKEYWLTLQPVLIVKTHFDLSCVDFYTWIQNQTQLLSEIHGSEKYKPQNVDWSSLMM
jgi:hypothetical protein